MTKELIVGSMGLHGFEEAVANYLAVSETTNPVTRLVAKGKYRKRVQSWLEGPEELVAISCLNSATVVEFLRHAVQIEGYADENAGFAAGADGKVEGRNFPWWDSSLWLPEVVDQPGGLEEDPTFFIGSCQALISELDRLQKASPLRLGDVAAPYAEMRADYAAFMQSDEDLSLSLDDCVRWVWRALRDGAELAVAQDAPMWMGP